MRRPPSSARSFLLLIAVFAAALLGLAPTGCTVQNQAAACDSSKCAAGNTCIDDGAGSKCRLLCSSQTGCPEGYHCGPTADGSQAYCAPDKASVSHGQTGEWGASCMPTGGLDQNPSCAADKGFWCYGSSPTDGNSYCTQYDCGSDDDCAGGYWCATTNVFPDVRVAKRSFGDTQNVCLKREYCSPCRGDFDCPTSLDGQATHCVAGNGGVKLCTKECTRDSHCRLDAACAANDDLGVKLCMPRAGTCKGDGSLCSPCRSDGDCPKGFCLEQAYSHERYCTIASLSPCTVANGKLQADCPKTVPGAAGSTQVSCATKPDYGIPVNQCFGLVEFGRDENGDPNYVDGCWTTAR
jgi:hypothetical protein